MSEFIKEQSFTTPEEDSALYKKAMSTRPTKTTDTEILLVDFTRQLEMLAKGKDLSVEKLLAEAHTTKRSEPHHFQALQLERQIAMLKR